MNINTGAGTKEVHRSNLSFMSSINPVVTNIFIKITAYTEYQTSVDIKVMCHCAVDSLHQRAQLIRQPLLHTRGYELCVVGIFTRLG